MKVKCPTCNVKMKPYQREEIFPDGDTMINLKCPECGMKASLTYFRSEIEEYFETQEIIDRYNESQLDSRQESRTILDDYLAENALSPTFLVANYAMCTFEVVPSLKLINDDLIVFDYPANNILSAHFNLDEGSVLYSVHTDQGTYVTDYLFTGVPYADFTTYEGIESICEAVDKIASEFLIKELGGSR